MRLRADARHLRPPPRQDRGATTCCGAPTLRAPLLEALRRRRPARDPRRRARAARGRRTATRSRSPAPFFADVGRVRPRSCRALRQPRPRARRGLDRRPPAERARRLPRPRAALRRRRRGPLARQLAEAARPPARSSPTRASGCATTSTPSTATTPTCTPPSRRSSGSPPARWRAGSPGCPQDGATPDDYEAVLSPLYAWLHALTQRADHTLVEQGRRRLLALLRRAHPTRASRALAAPARLPRRGRHAQRARARPAAVEPLTDRAAARLPARHPGGHRAARHRRRARDLGPLAPLRPVADRRPRRVDGGTARASSTPARGSTSRTSSRPSPNGSPYWPGTAVIVDDDGPPELVRLLGDRGHEAQATPGVKHVAWTITPAPGSSVSVAARVAPVVDQQDAARLAHRERAAVDAQLARALDDRPHATRLVRAGVGARLVLGLRRDQRVRRVLGPHRRERLPRHARAAPGSRARSRRRRPRRSASSAAPAPGPTGSAPASPRCRRCPTPRARCRSAPPTGSPAARPRGARSPRRARAGTRRCARRRSAGRLGVALVPRLQVRQRAQRVDAAEVPELDQHGLAALLVHAQRRHVDPLAVARERRSGRCWGFRHASRSRR